MSITRNNNSKNGSVKKNQIKNKSDPKQTPAKQTPQAKKLILQQDISADQPSKSTILSGSPASKTILKTPSKAESKNQSIKSNQAPQTKEVKKIAVSYSEKYRQVYEEIEQLLEKYKQIGFITQKQFSSICQFEDGSEELEIAKEIFNDAGITIKNSSLKEINFGYYPSDQESEQVDTDAFEPEGDQKKEKVVYVNSIRSYMNSMNKTEILSKEAEFEIARQMEVSRDKILEYICKIPHCLNEITKRYDDTVNEKVMLRETVNVDSLYAQKYPQDNAASDQKTVSDDHLDEDIEFGSEIDEEISDLGETVDYGVADGTISFPSMEKGIRQDVLEKLLQAVKIITPIFKNARKSNDLVFKIPEKDSIEIAQILKQIKINYNFVMQLYKNAVDILKEINLIEKKLLEFLESDGISRDVYLKVRNEIPFSSYWMDTVLKTKSSKDLEKIQKALKSSKSKYDDLFNNLRSLCVKYYIEPISEFKININYADQLYRNISQTKTKMITANLRLVYAIAKRYMSRGVDFEDVIQYGNMGLVKAADRFDRNKGCKFSTYATWWIRQSIIKAASEQARMIRLP